MTARMARLALPAGPSTLHQHRGPVWRPAPILPEGEEHPATPPVTPPATPPAPVPSPPATPPAPVTPPAKPGDNLPDDPAALQAEIVRLRAENGKDRTAAKEKAAKDAEDALTQRLGKALGLIKDDEQIDPAKLAADLTAAQTKSRQADVKLAVFMAASGKGADATKLLDRNSFTSKVNDLDPTAKGFADDVSKAIDEALKNDPSLKATGQAPGASAIPAAGGSGENGRTRVLGLGAAVEAARVTNTTT